MKSRTLFLALSAPIALTTCSDTERRSDAWRHAQSAPSITVALDHPAGTGLRVDSVRLIRAPEVRFLALVERDLNHPTQATTGITGRLEWILMAGDVRRGDTLAVVGALAEHPGRRVTITADHRGAWWPTLEVGKSVWRGEVVGLLQWDRYSLAVGLVPDHESALLHSGDSAIVRFHDRRYGPHPGRVEWVRPPGPGKFSAEVAVEIRHSAESVDRPRIVEVTVIPTGPADSVFAVPIAAVAQLSQGSAVFVPQGAAQYQVKFIIPGRHVDDLVVVRAGIEARIPVVTTGLGALVAVAEDSLRRSNNN